MRLVKREIPKGKTAEVELKNIALNNKGQLFFIFQTFKKDYLIGTRNKKKVNIPIDRMPGELIVCLSSEEREKLIKFVNATGRWTYQE